MSIGSTPWLHKNSVAVIKLLRYKKSNFLGSHHKKGGYFTFTVNAFKNTIIKNIILNALCRHQHLQKAILFWIGYDKIYYSSNPTYTYSRIMTSSVRLRMLLIFLHPLYLTCFFLLFCNAFFLCHFCLLISKNFC